MTSGVNDTLQGSAKTSHHWLHTSSYVCCICSHRFTSKLVEVWASGNWHPICRTCLDDVDMGVFGCWSPGRVLPPVDGQLTLL